MSSITSSSSSTIMTSASPAVVAAMFWVWLRRFASTGSFMCDPFLLRAWHSCRGTLVGRRHHALGERAQLGKKLRRPLHLACLCRLLELERRLGKGVVSHAARGALQPVRKARRGRRIPRLDRLLGLDEPRAQAIDELANGPPQPLLA